MNKRLLKKFFLKSFLILICFSSWGNLLLEARAAEVALPNFKDPTLITKGKQLYLANCIACHNKDPNKKGSIGPELVGIPFEVFKTKVTRGEYPAGYVAKRKTKVMKKFPHLEKDVPSLFAYISSLSTQKN